MSGVSPDTGSMETHAELHACRADMPARADWCRSPVAQRIATPCVEIPAHRAPGVVPRLARQGHKTRVEHNGRKEVQEWGERPHGPGGALHRESLQRQARVDGRCRNQLVADAYRPSRWTRVNRYEPNESVENTKSPGGPFPPGS